MKNTAISDRIIELSMLENVLEMINDKINYIRNYEMVAEPTEDYEVERNAENEKKIAALKAIADKL
jgi:hypothetical protein